MNNKPFKPMLAGKVGNDINFPVMASQKLDGVRCVILNGVAMSRSLKPIPNAHVQQLIGKHEYNGLDGELLLGPVGADDVYRKTVSAVMSEDGKPDITFWVFDNFNRPMERFETRYNSILAIGGYVGGNRNIRVVRHDVIHTPEQLDTYEALQLDRGLEGVMIRDPSGPYKYGRSTTNEGYLLKLKRFSDSEAEIIGLEQLMHNANEATTNALGHSERSTHKDNMVPMGVLGALNVRDLKTKVEFSIGTGFDAATRKELWEMRSIIGKIVKYKFFASGSKDKPRFPVFIGFRDERDM